MLTKIEIDGFKTFKDFKVELAPFQVIVGPNGSGKSNLFDALHLLSRLVDTDLRTAFQEVRGDTNELFTVLPNGQHTNRIRIAVEVLVDREVQDISGGEVELIGEKVGLRRRMPLKYTRLRYEIEVTLQRDKLGQDQLRIVHESLKSIAQEEDNWCKKYGLSPKNHWLLEFTGEQGTFIDTKFTPIAILESIADKSTAVAEQLMIYLYPDSDEQERIRRFYAAEVQRTVMSRVVDTEHAHVFACREELRSLRFLHLNPESLRKPGSVTAPSFLSKDGDNLPTTLARMQAEDKFALTDVSRDMANLVPGISKIRVEKNQASNEYEILAETSDQSSFSGQALSDGTLRLLALATLRNDPQFHGVLCLEEPENGIQPLYLKNMARVLRDMATDFTDPQQADEPLKQVLVTTHSPAFISLPEVIDSLLFAHIVMRGESVQIPSPLRVTRMVPVVTLKTRPYLEMDADRDRALEVYTIDMVKEYLSSENLNSARNQLNRARMLSIEGRTG